MITSPTNQIYIGQTINFRRRLNSYKNFKKSIHQLRLKNSFTLHGFENHKINVLIECICDELNFWEEFYINLFDTFNGEHGLNATSGGKSHKRMKGVPKTQDWKEKISKAHIGKKRQPFDSQWKENMSKSHKGIIRHDDWIFNLKEAARKRKERNGYVITDNQKDKFRKSYSIFINTNKGIELRKKMAESAKKRFSKPIFQYTLNMILVKKWSSAREAALGIGISHPNLVNCTNNKAKSAGGYIWKKENDLCHGNAILLAGGLVLGAVNKNIEVDKQIEKTKVDKSFTGFNEETYWNDAFNQYNSYKPTDTAKK